MDAAGTTNDENQIERLVLEAVGPDDRAFLTLLYKALQYGWDIDIPYAEGRSWSYSNKPIDEEPDEC